MRTACFLLLVVLLGLSSVTQAQIFDSNNTRRGTNPFQSLDNGQDRGAGRRGGPGRGGPGGGQGAAQDLLQISYPLATFTPIPLKLMPPKARLVIPEPRKNDPRLATLDSRRRATLKGMKEARERGDQVAVSNHMCRLETLRQEKMTLLRSIADRVTPNQGTNDGDAPDTNPTAPKPVLPIPTLPPRTKKV